MTVPETITLPHPDWRVETGDPSVGIFGDSVVHAACPADYEYGVSDGYIGGDYRGTGADRKVDERHLVTCLDCDARVVMVRTMLYPDYGDGDE